MKRTLILVMALLASSVSLKASSLPVNTLVVEKSIVFLWYERPGGLIEGGTGFMLQIPLLNDPARSAKFIITARHIVDPQWAGCSWPDAAVLHARVNTKNYESGGAAPGVWETTFNLVRNETWFAPEDDKVDIAVIPFQTQKQLDDMEKNDVLSVAFADFATLEEIKKFSIGTGDGILSAGLVPALFVAQRNYPAFKFGRISNVLNEPLTTTCGGNSSPKERWAWVLSANFVGGNSGSPIFLLPLEFTLGPPLHYNGPRPMILGILSSTIEGADLAEMAPIEYVVPVLQRRCPDCNFFRGEKKAADNK